MKSRQRAARGVGRGSAAWALAVLVVSGCTFSGPGDAAWRGPSEEALANATYPGLFEGGAPTPLADGHWKGTPEVPGSASAPEAQLRRELLAFGPLDRGDAADAAVLIETSTGGSGTWLQLAAVLATPAGPRPLPAVRLGDRVQVRSLAIAERGIETELVVAGPEDPACCPTRLVRRSYRVVDGALREVGAVDQGVLSAALLEGTSWQLLGLDWNGPLVGDVVITARFADGRVQGAGGCNAYHARVTPGAAPALSFGPVTATRRACPEPAMGLESRYLAALGRVTELGFSYGRLALAYPDAAGRPATLLFWPQREAGP